MNAKPEAREAIRRAIIETIKANGWTQADATEYANIEQGRISEIVRGKIHERWTLDRLIAVAEAIGVRVEITVSRT